MNCLITTQELMITGGLALLFAVLSLWISLGLRARTDLPAGFKRAGMALQLSGTKAGVTQTVGEAGSQDRQELRANISKDFVFIFSYASFLVALSLVLSQANSPIAKWVGVLAAILAVGAAAADFVENYRMLQVLSTPSEKITEAAAGGIRTASLFKWSLFFLTIALQSIILLQPLNVYSWLGLVMLAAAIAGLIGLRFHQLLTPGSVVFWVCAIVIAVVFIFGSDHFLNRICGRV